MWADEEVLEPDRGHDRPTWSHEGVVFAIGSPVWRQARVMVPCYSSGPLSAMHLIPLRGLLARQWIHVRCVERDRQMEVGLTMDRSADIYAILFV